MRYFITEQERYPVYDIEPDERGQEISDDFVARFDAARHEWDAVQDILANMVD